MSEYTVTPRNEKTKGVHKTFVIETNATSEQAAHEEFLTRNPKYRNRMYVFTSHFENSVYTNVDANANPYTPFGVTNT